MTPSPLKIPQKAIDEMSPEEFAEWRAWLFAEGVNPVVIRQDIPPAVPSYSWDAALGATVEHVNGAIYVIELADGELKRVSLRENPLAMTASAKSTTPETRIRAVA